MAFDYSKLKGRIIEKYDSQSSFANAMEWSERTLSLAHCLSSLKPLQGKLGGV